MSAPLRPQLATPDRLRVLFVALNYAPEIVGCGKYTSELAEDLAQRGHQVEVVTAPPYYPAWRIPDGYSGARWRKETLQGVVVHRTPLYVPQTPKGVRRLAHLASFAAAALPPAVSVGRRLRPDIVFAVAPTLAASLSAILAAKIAGAKGWLHIQDFEVDAAFELGLMKGATSKRMALGFERWLLSTYDRVSTISPAMLKRLIEKGVDRTRVRELRNWVDIERTPAFPTTATTYRQTLAIPADHTVVLYSGNMAAKQGIEALADVAKRLLSHAAPITMVLCGEGPARPALEAACAGLPNVRFLPLQPLDQLPELLATADIHLLPQRPEAADLVLPSKLTGMLASARPVVAMALPGTGLADEIEGCGVAVRPDAVAMAEAILRLVGDGALRSRLGRGARARAEQHWDKRVIIDALERDMTSVVVEARTHRHRA